MRMLVAVLIDGIGIFYFFYGVFGHLVFENAIYNLCIGIGLMVLGSITTITITLEELCRKIGKERCQ